jgi:hypothetical protein
MGTKVLKIIEEGHMTVLAKVDQQVHILVVEEFLQAEVLEVHLQQAEVRMHHKIRQVIGHTMTLEEAHLQALQADIEIAEVVLSVAH